MLLLYGGGATTHACSLFRHRAGRRRLCVGCPRSFQNLLESAAAAGFPALSWWGGEAGGERVSEGGVKLPIWGRRKRWREEGGRRYEGASWPSDLWSDGGGFSGFSVMGFERCQIGSQEALFVSEMDIRRITCVLKNVKFWIDIFIVKCIFDKAPSLLELELNQTVSDSPYRDVYYKRRMY